MSSASLRGVRLAKRLGLSMDEATFQSFIGLKNEDIFPRLADAGARFTIADFISLPPELDAMLPR